MTTPHCGFGFGSLECYLQDGHLGDHQWHSTPMTAPAPRNHPAEALA